MPTSFHTSEYTQVKLHLPTSVLWIITVTGLLSGWWQLRSLVHEWDLHIDMEVYRAGANAFLDNESLYSRPFPVAGIQLPFIYPPFGAFLLTPFHYLSEDLAATSMIVLSGLLTLMCILFVARALVPLGRHLEAFAIAALVWPFALLSEPQTLNASFGQINVVVMALCVLDLVPRRRFLPQGTFIGLAAAIKLTPLVMCLFFLLNRKYRAIFVAAASMLLATGLTACFRLQDTIRYYTDVVFKMNSTKDAGVSTAYISNQSIKGMVTRWLSSPSDAVTHQGLIDAIWFVLSLVTIAGCAVLMAMMLRRQMVVDAALVNALLMLLISPISWSHHWVWLPLVALVLIFRWLSTDGYPVLIGLSASLVSLFCLQIKPLWFYGDLGDESFTMTFFQKLVLSGYTWMAFAVLIAMYFALRKTPVHGEVAPGH
ncbi:glycosyltransferase family 87 protein [Corynebacterium epidermidicanis]|uniref:Putative DUF2029 family protein n=1 Tax=Corynebacterium epidermidicanis TaxID=1050174 RepID=A0A0G3GTR6_9CORY|nr:glycosyltransferase family 87 protein [Corynebacterium epidermidicanis]AKK02948.1 putative DUF2029 family protein [Corynebacterium epidermidicanis]